MGLGVAGDWATEAITDAATPLTSTKTYTYDADDRLTNVQDTLDGQCTTRAYAYDADSNRTSLTSYVPNSDGTCQDSTGTTTTETYDSADRATNSGYAYDTQGGITTTPSTDADGDGNLTATYSANDMIASQTQNGTTTTWALDPTLGRFDTYTQNGVTYTNHFSDTSNNPTWTSGSDGSWTRDVVDFSGNLAAEVTSSAVTLELPDLHGDIMATATTSATVTGPTNTYIYTEFGAPETGTPGTYGWLGADQISSNALGGQLLMGSRAYNSNTGRFSQVDPIPGGSANDYDYVRQNPVTGIDLAGTYGCEAVGSRTAFRYCWLHLSENTVRRIELGMVITGASLGLYCASVPICQWFIYALVILGGFVAYYDNNGEWLHIFEYRYVVWYFWGTWDGRWTYYYANLSAT